jgi:TPP-dependent pyruvate/acetoin dehydrogenase alpha subunit
MTLGKEQLIKLYTNMVRARKVDEHMRELMAQGKITGFYHSPQGQEAIGVGIATFLREDDYVFYTHRGHGLQYILAKGMTLKGFIAEHYGKATGTCGGISYYHAAAPELGVLGYCAILGVKQTISAGVGLAAKLKGKGQVVICVFGDGEANRGHLHEAMNVSAVWKLPVIWVCENNQSAMFMPTRDAWVREDIADLAAGYGMPGAVVDGQDVIAVYEATEAAIRKARAGEGPSMLEFKTFRMRPHSEGMPQLAHADRIPDEEIEAWKKKDPIEVFQAKLMKRGVLTQQDVDEVDHKIAEEVAEADRFAVESPNADASVFDRFLYAE